MWLKEFLVKTGRLLHIKKLQKSEDSDKGQIDTNRNLSDTLILTEVTRKSERDESLAKLEKLEQGFSDMLGHLEGINSHLKSLPEFVENQRELTSQLIDYIRSSSDKDDCLIEAVKLLPKETAEANKRVIWMFAAIVGVCLVVILTLAGIIISLK